MRKKALLFTLAILTAFQIRFGIAPAFSEIDSDFPNYYTSARLILEGADSRILYDDIRFQSEIRGAGMDRAGKFTPFPPLTSLIMVPIAWLSPLHALQAWTVVNIALLAACVRFIGVISGRSLAVSALVPLAAGLALANNFRLGQVYLLLLFFMLWGVRALMKKNDVISGMALGSGMVLKYFPVVIIPLWIIERRFRPMIATLLTVAALFALGIVILGLDVHIVYLTEVLPFHLLGSSLDPYSTTFQSFRTLFNRYFVYDAALNPYAPFDWPAGGTMALAAVYAAIASLATWGILRSGKFPAEIKNCIQLTLLTLAVLLLSPGSATYHFLILCVPATLALRPAVSELAGSRVLQIGFAAALSIGFLPYSAFKSFEHSGLAMILAYPRLITLVVTFSSILCYIHLHNRRKIHK